MSDPVVAPSPLARFAALYGSALCVITPLLAIVWVLSVPQRMGLLIYPEQVASLMLGAAMSVVFLRDIKVLRGVPLAIDLCLAAASTVLAFWVFTRFPVLSEGQFMHPTESAALGLVVVLLVMEGLRRVVGWTLVVIFAVVLLYALFGDLAPAAIAGRPMPLGDVLGFLGADSTATWGQALQIAAFIVVVFVLFGGMLMCVGGGDFFTQVALKAAGDGPGNTAKVAVGASALMGSVSGSAVSNVMSTGVMTIPLMKRAGFRPEQAGAIEAVASTGGQLMPPIMGAAAFLMAEILQIPYREILLAALLPAALYYISIFTQIDFIARRDRIAAFDGVERAPMLAILRRGWIPVLAFAVLILLIFEMRMRAEAAAVWTVFTIALLGAGAHFARLGGASPAKLLEAFVATGRTTCDVLLITAAAGMIIGLLSVTGLGFALSYYLLDFGEGNLFGLLLVTGLVGIVLGLGLPTSGVYLLLASLAAPALVQLGIPDLNAHMFVFYYGMLSMITPPIALAAFAAASISGASQVRTGLEAFRFGWIAYLLPFFFIYKPGLLMQGSAWDVIYVFVSAIAAMVLVTGAIVGHARQPLSLGMRGVWALAGLAMMAPLHEMAGWGLEYAVSALGLGLVAFAMRRVGADAVTV
ncbi:TRAP transporter permease [Maritimibacter alkaliphilus]|uniref:TRAP transporter permease n=1 Tax=Maritimibacter alkaliphilus TaxID=404236 RepID=UPI001C96EB5A|nr:TRAP transporter fused permease subunit [Maritimibacter alkaliphilus]MBY6089864.1 TRAP transporter fused permease subunit [Maritimibacter alkaliphilus]